MMDFTFTPHALKNMQERNVPLQVVLDVLNDPQEIVPEKKGRSSYQSIIEINGKPYLLRVIVEPNGEVVTVYQTSKVSKYQGDSHEENTN